MDYHITKSFLDKAREHINKHKPYPQDDPIFDCYDAGKDFERCRSTMLVKMLEELGFDPHDKNDYGNITE